VIKKLSAFSILLGLVLSAGCSGSSSPAPPVPTPPSETWGISLSWSGQEIVVDQQAAVVATVTKNNASAPDGTLVSFVCLGCTEGKSGFVKTDGTVTVSAPVSTGGGKAGVYFKSADAGSYTVKATVFAVSASIAITVKKPVIPPNPHLQIFDIVPDTGTLAGGEQVKFYGKDILEPVIVTFTVDGVAYDSNVLTVAGDGTSMQVVTPKITAADPTKTWDATVEVKSGPQGSQQTVTIPKGFTFNPTSGLPQIYQLFPDNGSPDGGETVTIYGQNFKEPVQVQFTTALGTADAILQSVSQDGRQIVVTTPRISIEPITQDLVAQVKVINQAGTGNEKIVSKDQAFLFKAPPKQEPPEIYQLQPDHGSPLGGERVTILGKNFKAPVRVQFATNLGTVDASGETVSQDGTQIEIITPQISAQPITTDIVAKVVVINQSGTTSEETVEKESAFVFSASSTLPEIYQLVPDHGTPLGGDSVTIMGKNFKEPVKVEFDTNRGTVAAIVNSVASDGGQIEITTPQISAQPITEDVVAKVRVINQAGTSSEQKVEKDNAFVFSASSTLPEIYQLVPDHGTPLGGDSVTIMGKNFKEPVNVELDTSFGTATVIVDSVSLDGSRIEITTPQITAQPVNNDIVAKVRVINQAGTSSEQTVEKDNAFVFNATSEEPEIYQVVPDHGSPRGGDQVTIFGQNLKAPAKVQFATGQGTFEGSAETVSPDGRQIQVITPQVTTQPLTEDLVAKVTVISAYGTASEKTVEKENGFVFTAEQLTPNIATLSPINGPVEGGTQVTIFAKQVPGSGFQFPVQVVFSSNSISDHEAQVVSVNQYQIVCVTPDIRDDVGDKDLTPPIAVDVTVTNVDTGLTDTASAAFTYGEPLFITGNTPTEGPMEGGNVVTIYGSGFRAPLWVDFSGENLRTEVISVSGTQITVKMPAIVPPRCDDLSGAFTVTLRDNGTTTSGGNYTYLGWTPLLLSVEPPILSPPDANSVNVDELTIHGQNFHAPVQVAINGRTFTESTPGVTLTLVDENTITLSGILNLIGPDNIGLQYDTTSCVINGGNGVRDVATAVDVSVTNLTGHCTATLGQGLTYEPYDTTCRAEVPEISVAPDSLDFGDTGSLTDASICSSSLFTIVNAAAATGNLTWNVALIGADPGEFNFTGSTSGTLAPGGSVDVPLDFCPTSSGVKHATVEVHSDDPDDSLIQVELSGNALPTSSINVSDTAHTYPDTPANPAGTSCSSWSFNIANNGIATGDLVWNVHLVGADPDDFKFPGPTNGSVAPGDNVDVQVDFCPRTAVSKTAIVEVQSNDPDDPVVDVVVSGTGT